MFSKCSVRMDVADSRENIIVQVNFFASVYLRKYYMRTCILYRRPFLDVNFRNYIPNVLYGLSLMKTSGLSKQQQFLLISAV